MTNLELVSKIVNSIKALNKDEHISRRYILNTAKSKARFLMSQKLRDKTLYRESNLFSYLNCFELEEDNIVRCKVIEFRKCDNLMKSKCRLPELIYSRYGDSVISVMNLDSGISYTPITPVKYALNKHRLHSKWVKPNYYYIEDGYLYLPDSNIRAVDVVLITMDNHIVDEISGCGDSNDSEDCKSIWDYEFKCSDKLLEVVIRETLQEVLSTNKRIVEDENPDMDSNQKSKTTN